MALIPGKNPQALLAYYLGVFSFVPCLGIIMGIPAIVLGILGLRAVARDPQIEGAGHAWAGIILGSLTTALWIGLIVLSVLGGMFAR